MSKPLSFDATIVQGTCPLAGSSFLVEHEHGKAPADAFVTWRSAGGILSRGATQWTKTNISLLCDITGMGFVLMLIGQEARSVATKQIPWDVYATTQTGANVVANGMWPDAATHQLGATVLVPSDYAGGNVTMKMNRVSYGSATNTAVMNRSVFYARDGVVYTAMDSAVAMNFVNPGTANKIVTASWTGYGGTIQANDVLWISVKRLGADGSDNMAAAVDYVGGWMEYSATT